MLKKASLILTLFLLFSFSTTLKMNEMEAEELQVSDARVFTKIKKYGEVLNLNGHALKERVFIDLYVASLYIKQKNNNPFSLINANDNQTIRINLVSSLVTTERFKDQFMEQLEKEEHKAVLNYPNELNTFLSSFNQELNYGDVIDFSYSPSNGLEVLINGRAKCQIKNLEFKKLISAIWLGNNPFDEDLKSGLLGLQ